MGFLQSNFQCKKVVFIEFPILNEITHFFYFIDPPTLRKVFFCQSPLPPSPNSAVVVHRSLARQLSTLLSCYQTLFFLKARFKKKNSFPPPTPFSSEKKQSPRTKQCKSTIESASITMHCSAQHTAVTTHGKSLKEKSAKKTTFKKLKQGALAPSLRPQRKAWKGWKKSLKKRVKIHPRPLNSWRKNHLHMKTLNL